MAQDCPSCSWHAATNNGAMQQVRKLEETVQRLLAEVLTGSAQSLRCSADPNQASALGLGFVVLFAQVADARTQHDERRREIASLQCVR
jgi:hypothetical protein